MKDVITWILTVSVLLAGLALFYYGVYFFFGGIGVFVFLILAIFWLLLIQKK